jgi:hypothetical protein
MPYRDVCIRGRPAGGRVRQDDVPRGANPADHNAGGPSWGILGLIQGVIRDTPIPNDPPQPGDFPNDCRVDHWPGRGNADVHLEGRAVDAFFNYRDPTERVWGDWLFDWCVANCELYGIQGVIFGDRQWFSEMHGGRVFPRQDGGLHYDHVHIELNCDGANTITIVGSPSSP